MKFANGWQHMRCKLSQVRKFASANAADAAKSLATRRATVDDIQATMVERLIELDRVEPDFDPLTWYQGIRSYKGSQQQKKVHNLGKGITGKQDYEDATKAQKMTPAYIRHMKDKPAKGGQTPRSWHDKKAQLMVDHIKSTTYTSQATEKITTTAQTQHAEGNRLLTYLYFSLPLKNSLKPKGKDAKAPESAEMSENPKDDEE
jgi:hypothetical protein